MSSNFDKALNEYKTTVMPKEDNEGKQSSQGLPGIQLPTEEQLKVFEGEINKMDPKELNEKIEQAKAIFNKKE